MGRDPGTLLSRFSGRWYWTPAVVLLLGIVSLAMLISTNRIYEGVVLRDQTRVGAIEQIQLRLATAHLWLEEHLTGDQVDLQEISDSLARADTLVTALLEGGQPSSDRQISRLRDGEMREHAARMQVRLGEFNGLSLRRLRGFTQGEPIGIGSELDVRYDAVFDDLLADAQDLEAVLKDREARNRARARVLSLSILGAWVAIVASSVIGLWKHERRRARAEEALRISRAQLMQSQKLDAVGRLAGGMAHDINNYLGAIRAQTELIRMKPAPRATVSEKMEAVLRAVDKASSLIERLLAFSRQEPVRPEVVNLNRIVTDGVGAMVRQLIGEDMRLETELDKTLWNVKIDPSQIEQALVNLVINARQAMPKGGVVRISTGNSHLESNELGTAGLRRPGDYVWLSVADSGPGIPPEIRDKIFEPFFTTKPKVRNSGLGLSTVHGIVEQNGGGIRVDTAEGQGTRFTIHLPRSHGRAAEELPAAPLAEPHSLSGTVLLVEDNDELRRSAREMIEAIGYEVIEAANGLQALECFDEIGDDIDLVITDVVMPGMNGRELVDRLKQQRDDLRVLYTSGYTGDVILRHGIAERDVFFFLKKPFSADGLIRRIRELMAAD